MTTDTTPPDAHLAVVVNTAIAKVQAGTLSLADLLAALAPQAPATPVAASVPLPSVITDSQREALAKVTEVFGKVVPTERRELSTEEVTQLVEEKQTLDELKKLAEKRHESIRSTLFNHLDVEAEARGVTEGVPRDKDGHFILYGQAPAPTKGKVFKREVRNGSPSIDAAALAALADDPSVPDFTYDDYVAMTTQTRVFDEEKMMMALKANPQLIHTIAKVIRPGTKTASINLRNL